MTAYYNEFDPKAAAWLRELIKAGHIAQGDVDERSIVDIRPSDLIGYTQCHFFAGIGVWSYALRRAGWPDDRPVWTGSCPCQPFSAAGKGAGFTDERHLWPHFHWLIENCRPPVVFGEQVASKDGLGWLDLVQADLEGSGYASGTVDTCAAGFGAPHIRQRLYWVAHAGLRQPEQFAGQGARSDDAESWRSSSRLAGRGHTDCLDDAFGSRLEGQRGGHPSEIGHRQGSVRPVAEASEFGGLADSPSIGRVGRRSSGESHEPGEIERSERFCDARGLAYDNDDGCAAPTVTGFHNSEHHFEPCGNPGGMAHPELQQRPGSAPGYYEKGGRHEEPAEIAGLRGDRGPNPTNGHWRDADWLFCRDGKWRPVEPGTFPLAHGAAARVGRLRGYGNAIVAPAAQAFIEAYLETGLVAANDNDLNRPAVALLAS
ncbi:DNA cytosine methyltransferase [Ochrobactrum sp. MT180101]|nr:DNA cytosine methyltransferase [Ochrobactrum sp. MT180101]